MKEVSGLRLKINSQNRRLRWQYPKLIDLAGRRQRAQGANCVPSGSGNTYCNTGNVAGICQVGPTALDLCSIGIGAS